MNRTLRPLSHRLPSPRPWAPILCLLLLAAAVATAAPAFEPITPAALAAARARAQWQPMVWTDHPVRIELRDREQLDELLRAVPLSRFGREDVRITLEGPDRKIEKVALEVRVTEQEHAELVAAGWKPEVLRDLDREGREAAEKAWATRELTPGAEKVFTFPLTVYPSHAEVGQILADLAAAHPTRARTFQWGTSIQGRALWGIVISDNVQSTEAEPEVRFSSTMHGDEVTGMILTLDFANYLLANYGVPGREDVTNLVDNYEIHLMPNHNPDGTYLTQRYNANSVDLNRNFPEPAGTQPITETENLSYMAYANSHHFVVSGNYHGGALVMNYLWDWTYTLAPDDAALSKLSLEYSTYNLPMYNGDFPQGITNGADWYVATGTVQDWAYDQTGCIDTTIEVSNTKWPAASTLVTFWNENREGMMHYLKAARYGINGVVTAADTGDPLAATVTVTGNSKTVTTDPEHGDYYKLLDSGTYQLTFSAPGYITQTISNVATTWGTPTVLNVQMQPTARGDLSGLVLAVGGAPLAAQVQVTTHPLGAPVTTVTAGAAGDYAINDLEYGDYRLVYTFAGRATANQVVTVDAATITAPTMYLAQSVTLTPFASNFDDGLTTGWTGTWALLAPGADGTAWEMTDSPAGNYVNNTTKTCTMAAGADLSDLVSGSLTYRAKWNLETNWDGVQLQVSVGGGAWTPVGATRTQAPSGQGVQTVGPWYEGAQATWVTETVDLTPWLGLSDVRFQFVLRSDSSTYRDGFHFDTFLIQGEGIDNFSGTGDLPAVTRLTGAQPNPFNPSTTVRFELARAGHARLRVYDLSGRLVRELADRAMAAGPQAVAWDGRDGDGQPVPSGVYLVKLSADGSEQSVKASLVK
ncbi:MAG: carboxypeptidase regulatory-like domain-containing protein [bacterium]|nr:carboxypeptidase regulatory-like domain-containing protein [bacterium]